RNCWEGRSVRASSLLRQNSSSVPLSLGRTRPCKTTASPVCWKGGVLLGYFSSRWWYFKHGEGHSVSQL
ncbi:hypothetical protein BCW_A0078, partial [Bacillus cereus W]